MCVSFQLTLQKHVNQHFNAMDVKEGSNKRYSDPPVPKQLKKNGKKLKYRRTPFSGKCSHFFIHFSRCKSHFIYCFIGFSSFLLFFRTKYAGSGKKSFKWNIHFIWRVNLDD